MLRYLLWKFLRVVAVLFGVTLITFLLMHAIPGNPWSNYSTSARMMLNLSADKYIQREVSRHFGLDLPLWRQFTRYLIGDFEADGGFFCGAVCGNLGPSIEQGGLTVNEVLFKPPKGQNFWKSAFGYSVRLVFFGSLFAAGLGIPLGILSARKPRSALSRGISVCLAVLISIPNFVLGLLAVIVLASWLRIMKVLPNWNDWRSWIVPALILAVMPMASIARVTHASLINIMNEDYVRTAYAKGLTQARVILRHVLRNALVPIITFMGPTLMEMFTGLFIVESLYSFPGFGRSYWEAVLALDYPVILGMTLLYALGIALVNVLIDILGAILDPRLRSLQQRGAE